MDGLAEDIQKLQPPVDLWRKFVYCTSISGSILGLVDHMQPQDLEKEVSPESVAHYSQYKLLRLLQRKLESLGFKSCTPDELQHLRHCILQKRIIMGLECTSIRPTVEGVKVGASFLKDGKLEQINFHCSFLIGSDGARSTVRKLLGIKMQGEHDLQKFVSVHFFSKDLGEYLLHKRPGMLFFILNPEAFSLLVAHNLNEGEFVLQIPYHPPQQNSEDFSSMACEKIISKLVGWKLEDLQIKDIKPWVMHAEVAEKYVACNDRVILVGDAAHRFPPAGGFGMNTGIQDAHNLAWKICLLLRNVSSASIVKTYEIERRPIAISNMTLSMENLKLVMSIPAALGVDPAVANSGLKKLFNDGKSLQLLFTAHDLGFRYLEGALVAQSNDETWEAGVHSFKLGPKDYVASSKPGSRLPHMQIKALTASLSEVVFSILDLVPGDELNFFS